MLGIIHHKAQRFITGGKAGTHPCLTVLWFTGQLYLQAGSVIAMVTKPWNTAEILITCVKDEKC